MRFTELQTRHEMLLDLQNKDKPIVEEVMDYINDARNESKNYSPEERDLLRANLRYWAGYIVDQKRDYPDTELAPISQPNTVSLLIQNSGKVLYTIIIVAVFLLGLAQIPKIINVIQSPPSTNPPQVVIYDKGGTIFIVLFSIFALIVIFLQVIIFRRQTELFVLKVGASVSNAVGVIRKTIVGGGRRGKPLATLKMIDGPPAIVGQELKLFSESVKLGRDPQKADMIFYTSDTNTSISGLHARIDRVNNTWRIVALSQSGSETFVDDKAIPSNEPVSLTSGQTIRLGYFAQLPVIFTFNSIANDDPQKPITKTSLATSDDIFDEFRERGETKHKQNHESADDIFDEFRERD